MASSPPHPPRFGVVDLGSNSVRLVVYQGFLRNPHAIFNEKAVLGLGRGLHSTGLLNEEAAAQTLTVLGRYHALARGMGAEPVEVLATAAVRDANNGRAFMAGLAEVMPGVRVTVLSGDEEARFSAEGLLLAAARGFTQYGYSFVQEDADEMEDKDLTAAEEMRGRARRLYLRAHNYGLRGLEVRHKGFGKALRANPKSAVSVAAAKDVPLLYWTALSWAAAISLSKDNPDLIAELPMVEAMMDRALVLDEAFDSGSLHTYFITYEMSRSGGTGEPAARSRQHFERALALSGGQQAGPMVSFAEAVCVQKQDLTEFESLLKRALAINPDLKPEWRLANLVMQRRAKWLLARTDQLFLRTGPSGDGKPKSEVRDPKETRILKSE